jgi:diguanylate cyclase (GGDEF)-like protein
LSIAIADLDHFKRINDLRSHEAGDAVLQQVARLLDAACEPDGFAARLGGEEFLLVLPGHDEAQARSACEAFAEAVREHGWQSIVGDLRVTVSLGVTTAVAATVTVSALLSEADQRLYTAKRTGRDRVVTE